jgi:peroxiredoxin
MIKKLIILLTACLPQLLYAQREDFKIDGSFANKALTGKIYYNYSERGIYVKDSTVVEDGKFQFKGKIIGIQKAYFSFIPNRLAGTKGQWQDSKTIFIEPGSFQIIAKDSLSKAKVEGSPINTAYVEFQNVTAQVARDRKVVWNEYIQIKLADRNTSRSIELKEKIDETAARRENLLRTYIETHPSSYFSIEAIIELMGPYVATQKVEKLWQGLDPKLKESYNGKMVNAVISGSKATDVGAKAPQFAQPDTAGNIVKLTDIKGKYIFVDFWASWCHPCRAENPNVLKAYNNFKDRNFTVIGISIDVEKDHDKWMRAIHDDGIPWTQLISPSNVDSGAWKTYGIRAIPSNYLIDPNGIIVAKNLHGEELQKKLKEILK